MLWRKDAKYFVLCKAAWRVAPWIHRTRQNRRKQFVEFRRVEPHRRLCIKCRQIGLRRDEESLRMEAKPFEAIASAIEGIAQNGHAL